MTRRNLSLHIGFGSSPMPSKASVPQFSDQLLFDVSSPTATANRTQAEWNTVASWYAGGHWEGHNWSRLVDSDASTGPRKLVTARPSAQPTVYVNGSYVTQGTPWFPFRVGAHLERRRPLGIATLDTTNGQTLSAALTSSGTTLSVTLATTRPTFTDAHPNGTPNTFWPMIGSTLAPAAGVYSRSTAEYVSWVRVDDEVIGLPAYSAGTWSIAAGVATITGCVRGLWGTTAAAHSSGAKVRTPIYIGSAAAAPNDAGLTGNPIANSTSAPLRYCVNFWDAGRGALHNGLAVIADTASMELQGLNLASVKTVSSASGATFTSTAHGFTNGTRVAFGGYDIPGGIDSLAPYYVVNAATNTFQVSLTSGGAAVTPSSTNAGNCVVAQLRATEAAPVTTGVWWDVTSISTYNNGDPYGNDITASAAIVDLPYDFTNGTTSTPWAARQAAKRAALAADLTARGFGPLVMYANNYLASGSGQLAARVDAMASGEYDGYPLEHFGQETTKLSIHLGELIDVMRGANGSGTIVNAAGHKAVQWVKCYDWNGTVFSAANVGQYLRYGYGLWLLAWRATATAPKHLTKAYTSAVTERPSDGEGHEVYFWNFGVPAAQLGGKPTNPSAIADLHNPTGGLYVRKYTNGAVLVNAADTAATFVLDRGYYDCLTETGGDGGLTYRAAGYSLSVPAWDAAFLMNG